MQKEYRKLTENQFQQLIKKLPEIRGQSKDLQKAIADSSPEKLREILKDYRSWAHLYERPLVEHLAYVITAFGDKDWFLKAASSPDPQAELLRAMDDDNDKLGENSSPRYTRSDLIALFASLQRTIFSIMIYKRSISSLLEAVREGDEDALFYAIRVDRSAVACPSIANLISKAELLGDKPFFLRLRSALKGPQMRHWEGYQDLRYSLAVLRDIGLDNLSDAQLEHLLVKVLKVYPNNPAARKNLRKQYYESKKIKSL